MWWDIIMPTKRTDEGGSANEAYLGFVEVALGEERPNDAVHHAR